MITDNILFVGCGKMGGAILEGLLPNLKSKSQILVISPNQCQIDVKHITSPNQIPKDYVVQTIIFAVKPQILDDIAADYKNICNDKTLLISVAAGKKIEFFQNKFINSPIIRSMPNLPATIGKGITALYKNSLVSDIQKQTASDLFTSIGEILWLDVESKMDTVTAISGSGPAYVFYFIESLINAAVNLGLNKEDAIKLALNTVSGSTELAIASDKSVKHLKEQVISPKGTTEAGLNILAKDNALEILIRDTAKAAFDRSLQLSK